MRSCEMIRADDFNVLVEKAMQVDGRTHMRPVVEKELLHYDILFVLDKGGLLEKLTFQGGTSLRLCYGAVRFSEDLDFAGGKQFITADLIEMKNCIEDYIGNRYGLEVNVKEPKEMLKEPKYKEIKVDKWQIGITTSPARKDLPKQKIKIEVANIPAYSRVPQTLRLNYDFLPDGYSDTLVMTESLDEIMADKIISLVSCQSYIRHRDIWDLRWLQQQGAKVLPNYIFDKIKDYHITDYQENLGQMINRIGDIITSQAFHNETSRFIPIDVQERTLQKAGFKKYLTNEIKMLLTNTQSILRGDEDTENYQM